MFAGHVWTRWQRLGLFLLLIVAGAMLGLLVEWVVTPRQPSAGDESIAEEMAAASELPAPSPAPAGSVDFTETLGIEITGLQVGVGGTRLNLRYRVLDPARAALLTDMGQKAYLIDPMGRNLVLANAPEGAPIRRQSGQQLRAGRSYSHFFPNPSNAVKPGDRVSLVVGNLRTENLVVE